MADMIAARSHPGTPAADGVPCTPLTNAKGATVSDWMTIRVVLQGGAGSTLAHPPGRVLLVSAEHAFQELAEAIDTAFARWDLTPSHEFEVEGRLLRSADAPDDDEPALLDIADSAEVTVGEVGLREGAAFLYRFDPGEQWVHQCAVEEVGVDAFGLVGDEPEMPVPVFGWGPLPDQYGRLTEEDDELAEVIELEDAEPDVFELLDDEEIEQELAVWREVEASSWTVVEKALQDVERPPDPAALADAAARLRSGEDGEVGILLTAGALVAGDLPDDDADLWLEAAAGVVSPREEPALDPETAAAWATLEPADWAGAVIELAREGVGGPADPDALLELIARCPEVEGEDLTEEDEDVLLAGLSTVVTLWRVLGAVDDSGQLTALGLWGLPESLRRAWTDA
jgi:hypothetical protein